MSETVGFRPGTEIIDIDTLEGGIGIKQKLRKIASESATAHNNRLEAEEKGDTKKANIEAEREKRHNGAILRAVNLETAISNIDKKDPHKLEELAETIDRVQGERYSSNKPYLDKKLPAVGKNADFIAVQRKEESLTDEQKKEMNCDPDFTEEEETRYAVGLALIDQGKDINDKGLVMVGRVLCNSSIAGVIRRSANLARMAVGETGVNRAVAEIVRPLKNEIAVRASRNKK